LIVKVPVVFPAGTETVAGTVAATDELVNETIAPPVAAGLVKVTVPVEVCEPTMLVGFTESPTTDGANTPRVVRRIPPFSPAETVRITLEFTGTVFTVNPIEFLPAGTVTVLGTEPAF